MAGGLVNDCPAAVVASKSRPPELRCACLALAGEHGAAGRRASAGGGHEAPTTGRTSATDG